MKITSKLLLLNHGVKMKKVFTLLPLSNKKHPLLDYAVDCSEETAPVSLCSFYLKNTFAYSDSYHDSHDADYYSLQHLFLSHRGCDASSVTVGVLILGRQMSPNCLPWAGMPFTRSG